MQHSSLLIASLGFFLIHLVSATNIRQNVIAKTGENAWMGLFSALSLGFFVWMVIEYMGAERLETLWVLPLWWLWLNAILMFFALSIIIMGNIPDKNARLGKGVFAITRHPTNWGMAIFAACHMLSNGSVEAQLFWGAILGAGIIGSYFLDRRKIATGSERWQKSPENSSWLPFLALITGKTKFKFDDIKPISIMASIAVFFIAAIVHVGVFSSYILPL